MQETIGDVEFPCRSSNSFSALKACKDGCCLLDIPLEVWWSLDREDAHSVKLVLKDIAIYDDEDPISSHFRELLRINYNQEGVSMMTKRGTTECIIGARIRCLAGDEMDRDAVYEYLSLVLSQSAAAQQAPELDEYRDTNGTSEEESRGRCLLNPKEFSKDSQSPFTVNVEEVSSTVVKVTLGSLLEILVLGTSHDDKSSVVDVRNELAPTRSKVDSVVVELDETRMQLMEKRENEKTHLMWYLIFRVIPAVFYFLVCLVTKSRDLEMWREVLWDFYLFYITPGGGGFGLELVEAVRIGRRNQLDVVFGDMEMTNAYHSRAFFTPLQQHSNLRRKDDSNDRVESEMDDDVEQGLLQDKARYSQRPVGNTDEHVLSGQSSSSSAGPAKINSSSSLTPEDDVLKQLREGDLGLLKGSTLIHNFIGKDTSERDLRLAFAALFEVSGRKRLVVVGLAHVVGIVHILQRLLKDLLKDNEVDSLLSLDSPSEDENGDEKQPIIRTKPTELMKNWMMLRRGNRLRVAIDQLRALIGFNDILNDLASIRTLSQRFVIRSGCLGDIVIALEQHQNRSERDGGDSSRRIVRYSLEILLNLLKQWPIVDIQTTKGKRFIQRLKCVLIHIQDTDGPFNGDEQCLLVHQTMTILNEIPHGS